MDERGVLWNRKYWDIAYSFYWSVAFAGLAGIGKQALADLALPPQTRGSGSTLYRRIRSNDEQQAWMKGQEEVLNHVFNLAFGIAPDAMIEHCLLGPLGFSDPGPFTSHGLEIKERFGWGEANVLQQDGFFSSARSIACVELKLGAKISLDQICKYIALIFFEEEKTGRRDQIGLVLIAPDAQIESNLRALGLDDGQGVSTFRADLVDTALRVLKPGRARQPFETEPERMADIIGRLKFRALSWEEVTDRIETYCQRLDPDRPGDQTLLRLAAGLCDQIRLQVPAAKRVVVSGIAP